ncbi:Prefoldin subunit 6 [Talaromyces marneffei ATCC 18224]
MEQAQKALQTLSEEYQNLQAELETIILARQKLESQQQENQAVQQASQSFQTRTYLYQNGYANVKQKQEFASLDDDSNIYKLVGPVLLKQEKSEAVMAVDGRLEFIEKEIKRIEGQIQEINNKSDKKRTEIIQLQSQVQQQQPAAAGAVAA